ncbi:MAG: DUF5989 family protein [Planctomycetota bacterium]
MNTNSPGVLEIILMGSHKLSLFGEFLEFLKYNKKWWLLPIVLILVLLGALIVSVGGGAIAPFIYAMF